MNRNAASSAGLSAATTSPNAGWAPAASPPLEDIIMVNALAEHTYDDVEMGTAEEED